MSIVITGCGDLEWYRTVNIPAKLPNYLVLSVINLFCLFPIEVFSTDILPICSGKYREVAMVSAETPSENSTRPKFIDDSSCG